jgi:hypothetical protein
MGLFNHQTVDGFSEKQEYKDLELCRRLSMQLLLKWKEHQHSLCQSN